MSTYYATTKDIPFNELVPRLAPFGITEMVNEATDDRNNVICLTDNETGKRIDIATAETICIKCCPCGVYGVAEDRWFDYPGPAERRSFVRPAGSVRDDDWVCVFDLPADKYAEFEKLADAAIDLISEGTGSRP